MDSSIDSFASIPILIATAVAFVFFILLLIAKLRNTAKVSFIYFTMIGVFIAGLLYTYFDRKIFYVIITSIIILLMFTAYAFVLAVSDPKKIKEKQAKKEQEKVEGKESSIIDQAALDSLSKKFNEALNLNSELIEKASSFFSEKDAFDKFLEYFNKLITEKTNATGCAILVLDEFDNILAVKSVSGTFPPPYKLPEDLPHKAIRVETNFRYSQFALEGNAFGDIFTSAESVNIKDSVKDHRIYQNGPEDFLKTGPYIFIPIKQLGQPTALVCLARNPGAEPFSNYEYEAACNLASAFSGALLPLNSHLSVAEHTELKKEGDIASKFQKSLVPEKLPVVNKISIGKYSIQTENVCGDFYDIIPSRKDRITFVMSDIAGKGMNSLVIMIMIRAMIRLVSNTNQSAATILEWINKAICSDKSNMDHFASVALINYNSLNDTMQIATSGINPVLLYSVQKGTVEKISTDCEPIGVVKETVYKNIDLKLNAGDIIITCTDGLLECLNESGVQYSLDNLSKVIKANCSLSGKDIAAKVKDNIKKFCGNAQQYDDQSLLIVKIQG